jgi:hypothetical protein
MNEQTPIFSTFIPRIPDRNVTILSTTRDRENSVDFILAPQPVLTKKISYSVRLQRRTLKPYSVTPKLGIK